MRIPADCKTCLKRHGNKCLAFDNIQHIGRCAGYIDDMVKIKKLYSDMITYNKKHSRSQKTISLIKAEYNKISRRGTI
ncbi:MAG: hypothetical protein QME45_04250 [Clostridiales bacterium]|nr:hypothetical protein [Clostridiales bacterium]